MFLCTKFKKPHNFPTSAADLKLCTGLSLTMVATSSLGGFGYGLLQPSPLDPQATLLNADLALQFVPAMLFGTSIGEHANFHALLCYALDPASKMYNMKSGYCPCSLVENRGYITKKDEIYYNDVYKDAHLSWRSRN